MAGEATLMVELELPVNFNVADATPIPKGSLLELGTDFVVTVANGDNDVIAGIAAEEKIANDGKTKVAVYRRGWFKMLNEGTTTVGEGLMSGVSTGSANAVITASSSTGSKCLGTALESAGDGETILVDLLIGANQQ